MTTTPPGENPMTSSAREYDDLTVITGIKQKTQQLLKEQFNVRTYRELANLSPAAIDRLKAKLIAPLRHYVDGWIDEAQELAGQSAQQVAESVDAEAGAKANSPATESEWQPFAAFWVEFQGREVEGRAEEQRIEVSHVPVEHGAWLEHKRTEPTVIEGERLHQWMLEQVGKEVPPEPGEAPNVIPIKDVHGRIVGAMSIGERKVTVSGPFEISREEYEAILEAPEVVKTSLAFMVPESETEEEAAAPEAALPEASIVSKEPAEVRHVTVEIKKVQAFQPPDAETPPAVSEAGQLFSGFVRSGEPFRLEASFELTGPGADTIVKRRITYNAQFHVRNLTTKEKLSLGDTQIALLVEGEAPYEALLPQTSLQPGLYHLWALVTVHSTPPSIGYLEVPMLQVV